MRAVVFDLDGLIFNTEDLYDLVGDGLLRKRGKRFLPDLKRKMMGRPGSVALQIMIDHHALNDTVDQLQIESDAAFEDLLETSLETMPGLFELLDKIEANNLPMAVATSSHRAFAHRVLSAFDLLPRFEFVLTSDDIVNGKPAPDVYQLAATRLNVPPTAMLVFEDSETGCRAAMAAEAITVAVPNRHTASHDFTGVRLIAETLADPRISEFFE